ncbi:hypothetical protein M409DRAFT_29201 [Zasmidium cellare ATCC 36951]|uniref:AMP-dependent synthetase/ligase domain-containing protein n=1 Tax=Zasmidium cellare ATCC 36951 TaxID=1080233 RepID=A0A6A6C003_ZASCE|nr:uncharacterized protein M409DRAFT_29201 [Zasmidium cellare ATCC 36951]KAF2160351.1 hypothetical protein M409DRAFT_29201 [Zasmidium cellare ATCC 36951]
MPLHSKKTVPVPHTSVPSFVFGSSPTASLPDEPIILDAERPEDRYLTLQSYRRWSQRLAAGLRRDGLENGDRVLFIAGNDVAWPVVFMGVLMAGGSLSGCSPALPESALQRMADGLEPKHIIASAEAIEKAKNVANTLGRVDEVILFDGEDIFLTNEVPGDVEDAAGVRPWRELLAFEGEPFDWTPYASSPDQIAAINYTSGSTGFSKGAVVTHGNILANAVQYLKHQEEDPWSFERGHPVLWLSWVPFYHVVGQNQFCVICPKRGLPNYIMPKFDLDKMLAHTEKYKPAHWYLMPPLLITMLSHPAVRKYDITSIRNVMVGGAPLRQSVIERFEHFMPHEDCRVIQGWGMTELTCVAVNRHPLDRSSCGTVGELLPNVEGKIMTLDGHAEVTEPYKPGEIYIRAPSVTQGYWKQEEKTKEMWLPEGWLRTGDFGHFDELERLYVSDRIQDVVVLKSPAGAYVLPTDLESALVNIPGVVDAGVTSILVPGASEKRLRGFVALDRSVKLTREDVVRAYEAKVKEHERLTAGLFVIDTVPKVPNGKVDRASLREMVV